MTFSPNLTTFREQRSQKKRGYKIAKQVFLKFGTGAIIFTQEGRFETKYFQTIKKFFKNSFKKKPVFNYVYKRKC